MLNKRQIKILELFAKNRNRYYTSNQLAKNFNVSIRTIKSDLKEIRKYSEPNNDFNIESLPSKGSKIIIFNESSFLTQLNKAAKKIAGTNTNKDRINEFIKKLISSNTYISKYYMMESLYISESTLYQTLNDAKRRLKDFNLSISYKTNHGYYIEGAEVDIRRYILINDIYFSNSIKINDDLARIYNVIANSFIDNKYQINEKTFKISQCM